MTAEVSSRHLTLLQFLKQARLLHAQHIAGSLPSSSSTPVYVLGNPSADLDSIISAVVYAYFASDRLPSRQHRPHIPLINLPDVPSGSELRRLRPEFVTALWRSTNSPPATEEESWVMDDAPTIARILSEHMITVADIKTQLQRREPARSRSPEKPSWQIDATMVDWNALPIKSKRAKNAGHGSIAGLENCDIRVIGCIDHHVDEGFLPRAEDLPSGQPLLVQPGPGSCTSLVVDQLRSRGLWPESSPRTSIDATVTESHAAGHEGTPTVLKSRGIHTSNTTGAKQAAQLALAAILIDTTNLTAKGRVQDVDRSAVSFLEKTIRTGLNSPSWDRQSLFDPVQKAKENSPNLLTFEEILDRDYKEWTVRCPPVSSSEASPEAATCIKLGFCASVKPFTWLVRKSQADAPTDTLDQGSAQSFLDGVRSFATSRTLDIIVVMTAYSSLTGQFRRELFIWAGPSDERREGNDDEREGESASEKALLVVRGAQRFAKRAISDLGLEDWSPDEDAQGDGAGEGNARHDDAKSVVNEIRNLLNSERTVTDGGTTQRRSSWMHLWRQTDVSKSRKQVAPLLREAVASK